MNDNSQEQEQEQEPIDPATISDPPITDSDPPITDPIAATLERRAKDLSLALKPEAVARKLRDELEQNFPEAARLYHISAELVGNDISFQVAMKSPSFGLRLSTDTSKSASLGFYVDRLTDGGWRIELGLEVTGTFKPPAGSHLVSGGKFSVTLSK